MSSLRDPAERPDKLQEYDASCITHQGPSSWQSQVQGQRQVLQHFKTILRIQQVYFATLTGVIGCRVEAEVLQLGDQRIRNRRKRLERLRQRSLANICLCGILCSCLRCTGIFTRSITSRYRKIPLDLLKDVDSGP